MKRNNFDSNPVSQSTLMTIDNDANLSQSINFAIDLAS